MNIQLLEIGSETEQLSACRLSLLLGITSSQNQISSFLKLARQLLAVDYAVLQFYNEPYAWVSMQSGLKAYASSSLFPSLIRQAYIDERHPDYSIFLTAISTLGLVSQPRLVVLNLQNSEGDSVGHVALFDHQTQAFTQDQIQMLQELFASLMKYIELKIDHAELKEMYEQQSALNFSKTKFFQIIAHDLRAPFHGLLGFSEVLAQERGSLDEDSIQNIADYLHDTTQSTYSLLESLLNWAMAEGGRFVFHPINFQLKQASKIVFDVLNGLAIKKNIQLIDAVPEEIKVFADINMVTSVIQNLVSNALKFTHMDGSGVVQISAEVTSKGVEIAIQDTGLGMTAQQIEQLFQPRLTVSFKGTDGEKGMGLGLVLCKRFVEINQGKIQVQSKEGEGTLFKVTLPQAESYLALGQNQKKKEVSP
ncbi:HAMP domain-containing histidine kinase [Acinetobacter sp. ANC 4910]|uniref:sensor histidine kinase n=1 Tax=Acinetobacter sp. ANC 4910 TaxID=2529850 RepID=UPI00104028C2|nr:HAMP domain-containing sensor histidine kinase [Acinetobacter sp. ANC 4910]TCB35676.1 HAMP domain-containing histidine kinase [Acinetobacter sp. ANC 4910]